MTWPVFAKPLPYTLPASFSLSVFLYIRAGKDISGDKALEVAYELPQVLEHLVVKPGVFPQEKLLGVSYFSPASRRSSSGVFICLRIFSSISSASGHAFRPI